MTRPWTRAALATLLASALVSAQTFTSFAGHLTRDAPDTYYPLCALLPVVNQVVQVDNTLGRFSMFGAPWGWHSQFPLSASKAIVTGMDAP